MRRTANLAGLIVFLFFWLLQGREPHAQPQTQLSTTVKAFIRVDTPVIALAHVRVIDGGGAAPLEDQTNVLAGGKLIESVRGVVGLH